MNRKRLNEIVGRKVLKYCRIPLTKVDGTAATTKTDNVKLRRINHPREFEFYYGNLIKTLMVQERKRLSDPKYGMNRAIAANKQFQADRDNIRKSRKERKQKKINVLAQIRANKMVKERQNQQNNNIGDDFTPNDD